jgi:hypothetical protein
MARSGHPDDPVISPRNSKPAHEPLALHRERIEREPAGLLRQDDGELSHLDQHLADDAANLDEEELDAGIAERLRRPSPTRALQPRGTVAIPDQRSLMTTSPALIPAEVLRR